MPLWLLVLGCSTEVAPSPDAPVAPTATPMSARPTRSAAEGDATAPVHIAAVRLQPAGATAGDAVEAVVDLRGDGAAAARLDFVWFVNGEPVPGAINERLRPGSYTHGDQLVAEVSLAGTEPLVHARSAPLTITNRSPVFTADVHDPGFIDGYLFHAADPDGDPIRWRLEGAPAGMSIDEGGMLHYQGSTTEKGGAYAVKVIAEDPSRDYVALDLPLTLSPGSEAVKEAR